MGPLGFSKTVGHAQTTLGRGRRPAADPGGRPRAIPEGGFADLVGAQPETLRPLVEVLDRQRFRSFADAEAALALFVDYYNYHRLSGALGWVTPAERYNGTPFTDVGFQNIPALNHLQSWLEEIMNAA